MGRTDDTHETLLDYSLVAPLTPISRAFSGIVDCLVDIQAGQIIFEGSLTRDQCRNVILDIVGYGEPTLGGVIAQHKAPVIERDTCTLEHVLSELEPHRSVIWPDVKS